MSSVPMIELANAPQDEGVAAYLANDLARQGVMVTRAPTSGAPLLLLIGPASAGDTGLQGAAQQAAQAGRALHVVRLGAGHYDWPALQGAASWTDAYGSAAQANVAALAARLREPFGAPPPSPWAAPSLWAAPPSAPNPPQPDRPPMPPMPPAGATEPSDRGSLIALFVIGGLGLLLLILYLTGTLRLQSGPPAAPATAPVGASPSGPASGAITDQWLTGTWKENCASREFMRFDLAGGVATFHNGVGRVSRSGDTLTITGGGGSIVMRVAYLSQDQMRATAQGGSQTLYRCG